MPDVNLNSDFGDGGMKFKIIDISVCFCFDTVVFIWYLFFSGLT